jgi:hypothetical protein
VIIGIPKIARVGAELQISAEINHRKTLWFRFPAECEPLLSPIGCAPFVVALLLLAMQKGEDIEVRGPLSPKLQKGLEAYQRVYHGWFPDRFRLVRIQCEDAPLPDEAPGGRSSGRACAFSGGVDSFYTFLQLQSEAPKDQRLSHVLFMAGFDMPLRLESSIAELRESYRAMMKGLGVEWIAGSTNVREFVNAVDWTNSHGQALAASALFFEHVWEKFYIPSSYTADRYPEWGTHPELDRHLSTESMEFVHHGAQANRVRKLALIERCELSHSRLRVCWIQDLGLRNCGECEKCVRTQVALEILGTLPRFTTFKTALRRSQIRMQAMRTRQARVFARELIEEAIARRRWSLAFDLAYALMRRRIFYTSFQIRRLLTRCFSFGRLR